MVSYSLSLIRKDIVLICFDLLSIVEIVKKLDLGTTFKKNEFEILEIYPCMLLYFS